MKYFLLLVYGILFIGAHNNDYEPTVHIVKMEGMKFIPKTIEIRVGDTVRWINESNVSHNVKAKDKSFKSTMLSDKGEIYEHIFKTTGTFEYYCQPHRLMGMKGTVIVKK